MVQAWLNAGADMEDGEILILLRAERNLVERIERKKSVAPEEPLCPKLPILPIRPLLDTLPGTADAGIEVRPKLIPLEAPWRDGCRYREAGAIEIKSRLDCYIEDSTGPWVRVHGVLTAIT